MSKILVFGVILLCFSESFGVDVQCKYQYENWAIIERVYECKVTKDIGITTINTTIGKIHGKHVSGGTPGGVNAIHIFGQRCHYFPELLHSAFLNLKGILIAYSGLKKITPENMKPFTKLQVVFFPNNDIEVLEKDLFKFNTQLKAIVMNHNKIKHVAHDILTPLKSLTKIFLYKNPCVDLVAVNPIQMEELVVELMEHCPPEEIAVQRTKVKTNVQMRFEELDARISELDDKMSKKLDQLSLKLEKLLADNEKKN